MEMKHEFDDGAFDDEYLDDQCPDCLVVFDSDEEFLNHDCKSNPYGY